MMVVVVGGIKWSDIKFHALSLVDLHLVKKMYFPQLFKHTFITLKFLKINPNALQGSEWVEPHTRRSPSQHLYNPPTLEQLINNPFPSQSHHQRLSMDDTTSVISATTEFSSKEIARLENRVTKCFFVVVVFSFLKILYKGII